MSARRLPSSRFAAGCAIAVALLGAIRGAGADPGKNDSLTTFVAIGHTLNFSCWQSLGLFDRVAEEINHLEPDYVFLLGDAMPFFRPKYRRDLERHFLSKLESDVYWAPGNHDLSEGLSVYRSVIGYDTKLIFDPHSNFVLINTSDSFENARAILEGYFAEIEARSPDVPTILLVHHKLWRVYNTKRSGFKTYNWRSKDVFDLLQGRVDYILAGDDGPRFRKNMVRGITTYTVGIGSGGPKPRPPTGNGPHPVYFVVGSIAADGELSLKPVVLTVPKGHNWFKPTPGLRGCRKRNKARQRAFHAAPPLMRVNEKEQVAEDRSGE